MDTNTAKNIIDKNEMYNRAFEHGQDDALEGRPYIPHLYDNLRVQAAYQRGYRSNELT